MKKIISFEKEISFSSMIGDIVSISLDHTLEFTTSNSVKGNFIIAGSYKMTEASTLEETFSYDVPVEIELTENLDLSTVKIAIDDFNYEIINDDILKCNIDVLLEGVEEIIIEEEERNISEIILESEDDRECDGDKKEDKEIEIPIKKEDINNSINSLDVLENEEVLQEINNQTEVLELDDISRKSDIDNTVNQINVEKDDTMKENQTNISSLFEAFESTEETFTTYSVYIFRREDTLDKVLDQYKITREQLSDYNDLDRLEIGSKLIIPAVHE